MSVTPKLVDEAIRLVAADDEANTNELIRSIVESTNRFEEACNVLSVAVARRLVEGSMGYPEADNIMNWVWSYITGWLVHNNGNELPQPAFNIYEAVDAGEYHHAGDSDQVDPVEKYTMPLLQAILQKEEPPRFETFES